MSDFKLKLTLTILSALLFSLTFIMLALVLPVQKPEHFEAQEKVPETRFDKMSKGMREGFQK